MNTFTYLKGLLKNKLFRISLFLYCISIRTFLITLNSNNFYNVPYIIIIYKIKLNILYITALLIYLVCRINASYVYYFKVRKGRFLILINRKNHSSRVAVKEQTCGRSVWCWHLFADSVTRLHSWENINWYDTNILILNVTKVLIDINILICKVRVY